MLNASQLAAVQHRDGAALLVAGPGAGKTKTVTERFAYLLRRGERPDRILCVTFSNDAAREMRQRIAALTGFSEDTLKASVSTFHSLGLRIVKEEREHLGWELADYPVAPAGYDKRILREFVSRKKVNAAKAYIAAQRRALISPQAAIDAASGPELELANVYLNYDEALCAEGLVDFDAMIYFAARLFIAKPVVLAKWRERCRFVIVDEAHDTSYDQMVLADLLGNGNVMTVCDFSQSIYRFRGATPAVLLRGFEQKKQFYLGTNYRSGHEIVEAFKPFADSDALSQKLVSEMRAASPDDGIVVTRNFTDEYEQAKAVADEIAISGIEYDQCAVLARTKAALFPFCEVLEERGIAYNWRGKNFWLSPEIQTLTAFARFAVNPKDYEAFVRAASSQALSMRYLGRKFAEGIAAEARGKQTSPISISHPEGPWPEYKLEAWSNAWATLRRIRDLRDESPAEFLHNVEQVAGVGVYDSENHPDDFSRENIDALARRAVRFTSLAEFVIHARKMERRRKVKTTGVTLSTIHASKGLEWKSVFCVSVCDGILPHAKSEDKDEERRIVYVALSRARNFLWISWHGKPSVFIDMLPERMREPVMIERAAVAVDAEQGRLAI